MKDKKMEMKMKCEKRNRLHSMIKNLVVMLLLLKMKEDSFGIHLTSLFLFLLS